MEGCGQGGVGKHRGEGVAIKYAAAGIIDLVDHQAIAALFEETDMSANWAASS